MNCFWTTCQVACRSLVVVTKIPMWGKMGQNKGKSRALRKAGLIVRKTSRDLLSTGPRIWRPFLGDKNYDNGHLLTYLFCHQWQVLSKVKGPPESSKAIAWLNTAIS